MPPEQHAGRNVGNSADIFSIGVMTLETLARLGPPGTGATDDWATQALQRIVVPESRLADLLRSALADAPEERIQQAAELGRQLSAAIRAEKPLAIGDSRTDETDTLSFGAAT
jgi:serine/threonine protein kinase